MVAKKEIWLVEVSELLVADAKAALTAPYWVEYWVFEGAASWVAHLDTCLAVGKADE